MGKNMNKVLTIAKKDFTDRIHDSIFFSLLLVFAFTTFIYSYNYGILIADSHNGLLFGIQQVARIMAWFSPLVAFGLTFDAISKEEISSSLNVLLCHPVYRDNIILAKFISVSLLLFLILLISINIAVGTWIMIAGNVVTHTDILRIAIFFVLIFLYSLAFAGIGILSSIFIKNASDAAVYNIGIWLLLIMCLFYVISAASVVVGYDLIFLHKISPMHYYAQVINGDGGIGWGDTYTTSSIHGIFDTSYTLSQWFEEFWSQIVMLFIIPLVLYIASFIAFLRKDITL